MQSQDSSEDGKTLSKNALYSSLAAYQQSKIRPEDYAGQQSRVPKSTMETSLTNFLQQVSQEFHRKRARPEDPKNNGSRPQSLADVEGSIRQKAVTLVGGGVNSSIPCAYKRPMKPRKRRRKSYDQAKSKVDLNLDLKRDSNQVLCELNQSWNDYIFDVLRLERDMKDTMQAKARFAAEGAKLELIGAQVRISSCEQKKSFAGRFGVLVGESKNTWKIWNIEKPGLSQSSDTESIACDNKVVVVPKMGSTIDVLIPIQSSRNDNVMAQTGNDGVRMKPESLAFLSFKLDPAAQVKL